MTTFSAQIDDFLNKTDEVLEAIIRGSIQDVCELMTRRQESMWRSMPSGGSVKVSSTFREGFVPVDTGELINSQYAEINGQLAGSGDIEYSMVVSGIEVGDLFEAGFTAEHARFMEYGFTHTSGVQVPGRFFVRNAVQQWPVIVEQNARQFG